MFYGGVSDRYLKNGTNENKAGGRVQPIGYRSAGDADNTDDGGSAVIGPDIHSEQ
jgi:hypothetical protein